MRHTAEWWAKRVEELARTGDSRALARRNGVKESTLLWWRTELRKRAKASGPRLLPVVVHPAPAARTARPGELEVLVEMGLARITLRGAVSAEHMAAIVSASARTC